MAIEDNFQIILLTYKRHDLLTARLAELRRFYYNRPDVNLLVVDNGSPDPKIHMILQSYNEDRGGVWDNRTIRIPENIGFGPAMNHGVEQSAGKYIFLLSDDVRITGNFVNEIKLDLFAYPDGIICNEVVNWPAGWNQFGLKPVIHYPQGYFLAFTRDVWEKLGGFDERFVPYDYEDVDLGYRAKLMGIPIVQSSAPVIHDAAGTIGYSPERMEHTVRMRALFAKKWNLPNVPERP